jgi:hypothetical protein
MTNRPTDDAGPEVRLRTMRILWAAFLMCVGLFFLLAHLTRPEPGAEAEGGGDVPTLLFALGAAGLTAVVVSFVVKAGFYRRAAEQRQPALLHAGLILALALCESAVLMGMIGLFVTSNDNAYALFGVGALGQALHFPRREQVEAAYYKTVG